ncbi:hypothetical protein [Candidatus Palauibacter sp.]|uniref:hypothetical protein n=1 Tax=Candidatus Palauibacter sp. TaxID=3101350 RepID=UPI003AF2E13E
MAPDLGGNRITATPDADEDEAGPGLYRPVDLRGKLGQQLPGSSFVEDVRRQFRLGFSRSGASARSVGRVGRAAV